MNIRPWTRYFALFLVTLVLTGCQTTQPATRSSSPTAIPTIIFAPTFTSQPTLTVTLTPTISATLTPSITPSPSITSTPMPSQTLDLTEVAFETYHAPTIEAEKISNVLTPQAVSTLNAAFSGACGYEYPSISPDGNWLADDCSAFHVSSRDGQKQIVITHKELSPSDIDVDTVLPYSWSRDSQYLYFSTRFCCVDSDSFGLLGPLYRVDLQSSTWIKVVGERFGNDYSFSPTGRRLLHIPGGKPVKFHIIDLQTNTEQWLELQNFADAGAAEWSPDGRRFAITAKNGSKITEDAQYALFLVSLDDLSITQLIPLSDHEIYATDWSTDDVLTIQDCFFDDRHVICKSFSYDLKSLPSSKP